jgi:hypothetical protein
MYFIDAVVKNMPQVQANFSCFTIILTGKIQGGTKRTKMLSVGFGYLPFLSIRDEGLTAVNSYAHKFGEFGIKLIMDRSYQKVFKYASKK